MFEKERIGRLLARIGELICREEIPVREYRIIPAEKRKNVLSEADMARAQVVREPLFWGGDNAFYEILTDIVIPPQLAGGTVVWSLRTGREGEWDALNPQFLAYVNGEPRQGMDVNHRELLLTENAATGETFRIRLSAFTGERNYDMVLSSSIRLLVPQVRAYYCDLKVPLDVARLLPPESDESLHIIRALRESVNRLDLRRPYSDEFFRSMEEASLALQEGLYGNGEAERSPHSVYVTGHTHIDLAWLWTTAVTKDKTVRSFSTVLELMDRYPEFRFMHSQPQEYLYVKENAPEIYARVKERIREGRWEPEGATFVEMDCNIPSGESLVRQFLYGCRFFEREFGRKQEILWLPDVFGYSAALPQLMKRSGVRYFMTTKISWNEFNKMPFDTFLWEGIDGSRILTHFIPCRDYGAPAKEGSTENAWFTTYNGMLNAAQVLGSWQRYSQKELNDEVLMSFGFGDGGGGPTEEMLENQRRFARGIPGAPVTRPCVPSEFFHELDKVREKDSLPRWCGELYLEYHRGTYTTMARMKQYNRRGEYALMDLEVFAAMAGRLLGETYPAEFLARAWETVLRNQFHDILPGSSIGPVYEQSFAEYEAMLSETGEETGRLLQSMADAAAGADGDIVVFNPNGVTEACLTRLPTDGMESAAALRDPETGVCYPIQKTAGDAEALVLLRNIPPHGYRVLQPVTEARKVRQGMSVPGTGRAADFCARNGEENPASGTDGAEPWITPQRIETEYFCFVLNEKAQFISIYDKKAGRELLKSGMRGNVLMSYEDLPHNYDAWDINHYYKEKAWEVGGVLSAEVTESGPLRGCLTVTRPCLGSTIVQELYFYPELRFFDIHYEIDWHETHTLLRNEFAVDILSSEADYEIQFGHVRRPTHFNTSWDAARFEVCAHKWIDVSEDGYGLSVLNDGKYGCSVHDGVIGLTLLKSPVYPNPEADRGHHSFTYRFCPHGRDWRQEGTQAKAELLNNPYRAVRKRRCAAPAALDGAVSSCTAPAASACAAPAVYGLAGVSAPNVLLQTVKREEDGEALILRCFEFWGRRSEVTVSLAFAVSRAEECSLLEETLEGAAPELRILDGGEWREFCFEIRPFEVRTFRVLPEA